MKVAENFSPGHPESPFQANSSVITLFRAIVGHFSPYYGQYAPL